VQAAISDFDRMTRNGDGTAEKPHKNDRKLPAFQPGVRHQ
jgi:hypothetical protein